MKKVRKTVKLDVEFILISYISGCFILMMYHLELERASKT